MCIGGWDQRLMALEDCSVSFVGGDVTMPTLADQERGLSLCDWVEIGRGAGGGRAENAKALAIAM